MLFLKKKEVVKPEYDPKQFAKDKLELNKNFRRLMYELGLKNSLDETYFLDILEQTTYGFFAKIYLRPGLSFSDLTLHQGKIQETLNCIWIMKKEQFESFATVKIVTKPIDKDIKYKNPRIKPYEMFIGMDFSFKNIINNCNRNNMFLIGGAVGSGKTRYLYQVLLSWILSCTPYEVEIYLGDIAKNEFNNLKYVKHVRYYCEELEQMHNMMMYLKQKIDKRKEIISKLREQGLATNIEEYNTLRKNSPLSYCYVVIDEYSVVVPSKDDTKEEKEMKEAIIGVLKKIAKVGRSLGIFCILALQKCTKEEMDSPILKNMAAVRISFRANDAISSQVLMGDDSAVGLSQQYGVYSFNGGTVKDYLFAPKITMEDINELIKPYVDKSYSKINPDMDLTEKEYSGKRIEKHQTFEEINNPKQPKLDYEIVLPDKDRKVIDNRFPNLSKSEKPKKNEGVEIIDNE